MIGKNISSTSGCIESDEFEIDYDYLIIACGMKNKTLNTPGLSEANYVYSLKNLSDLKKIRAIVLDAVLKCFLLCKKFK